MSSTPGSVAELMPPSQGESWTAGPIITEAHPAFGIIARNLPRVDGLLAHAAAVRAIAARIPDLLRLVSPGACKGSFELKCEGFSILKQEPAPLRLPGAWTFKEPVQIPPPAEHARDRPVINARGGSR